MPAVRADLPRGQLLLDAVRNHGGIRATSRALCLPYATVHDEWKRAGGGSVARPKAPSSRAPLELSGGPVLFLPDLQAPAHHPDALPFLIALRDKYRPRHNIAIGDETDFCWLSDYAKQVEADNPEAEADAAINFMRDLYAAFPSVAALHSNHVKGRIEKARLRARMPKWMVKPLEEILDAPPTWQWYEEIIVDDVLVRHGHKDGVNLKRTILEDIPARFGRPYSIVIGHHHSRFGQATPDILYGDNVYWGAFTGCLVDPTHPFFSYSRGNERLGALVLDHGRPIPHPMKLDKHGRWTGKL